MKKIEKDTRNIGYKKKKKKKNPGAASRSFDFVNHTYDYRPNWAPFDSIIIINRE